MRADDLLTIYLPAHPFGMDYLAKNLHNIDMGKKAIEAPYRVRRSGFIGGYRYHSAPGTNSGDYTLRVFVGGRGVYENSAGRVQIGGDFVCIVPPNDVGVLMANPDDPYSYYYCNFRGDYAMRLADEIISQRGGRFFAVSSSQELADHMRLMGGVHSPEPSAWVGHRELHLANILALLGPLRKEASAPALSAQSIDDYLQNNISLPTNLSAMADFFSISKTSLCRSVRRLTGKTALDLLEVMKIEWAQKLLLLGQMNIKQVALRVGYENPFYFSRVFTKRVGVSPRAWLRKNARAKDSGI